MSSSTTATRQVAPDELKHRRGCCSRCSTAHVWRVWYQTIVRCEGRQDVRKDLRAAEGGFPSARGAKGIGSSSRALAAQIRTSARALTSLGVAGSSQSTPDRGARKRVMVAATRPPIGRLF